MMRAYFQRAAHLRARRLPLLPLGAARPRRQRVVGRSRPASRTSRSCARCSTSSTSTPSRARSATASTRAGTAARCSTGSRRSTRTRTSPAGCALYAAMHELAVERFPDERRRRSCRSTCSVRSQLLRAGDYDELEALADFETGAAAQARAIGVRPADGGAELRLEAELDGLRFKRDGERLAVGRATAPTRPTRCAASTVQLLLKRRATQEEYRVPGRGRAAPRRRAGRRVRAVRAVTGTVDGRDRRRRAGRCRPACGRSTRSSIVAGFRASGRVRRRARGRAPDARRDPDGRVAERRPGWQRNLRRRMPRGLVRAIREARARACAAAYAPLTPPQLPADHGGFGVDRAPSPSSLLVLAALRSARCRPPPARRAASCVVGEPRPARLHVWTGDRSAPSTTATRSTSTSPATARAASRRIRFTGHPGDGADRVHAARQRAGDCHAVEATLRLEQLVRAQPWTRAARGRGPGEHVARPAAAHGRRQGRAAAGATSGTTMLARGPRAVVAARRASRRRTRPTARSRSSAIAAQRGLFDPDACGVGPERRHRR